MIASSPLASHSIADDVLTIEFVSISVTDFMSTSFTHMDGKVYLGNLELTDVLSTLLEHADPIVDIVTPPITAFVEFAFSHLDPGIKFGSLTATSIVEFTFDHNDPFILVDGKAPEIIYPEHDVTAYRFFNLSQKDNIFLPGGQPLLPNTTRVLHYIDKRHYSMADKGHIRIQSVVQDLSDPKLYVAVSPPSNEQTQKIIGDNTGATISDIIKLVEAVYTSVTIADNFSSLNDSANKMAKDVADINKQLDEIERHILELYKEVSDIRGDETVTILI